MFYTINLSPLLVTESVFMLIIIMSNYQQCPLPIIQLVLPFFQLKKICVINYTCFTVLQTSCRFNLIFSFSHREQEDYVSLSFATISSVGSNGAIIHYKATPETDTALNTHGMYLCDSGGQYRYMQVTSFTFLHTTEPQIENL